MTPQIKRNLILSSFNRFLIYTLKEIGLETIFT